MRFLPATAVGVVASAFALAACDGQGSTAPNETPSFSRISTETSYTATLTCNAAASRSYAHVLFRPLSNTFLFCSSPLGNQATVTASGFTEFGWAIFLRDGTGDIKFCPRKGEVFGSSVRTGQFVCKDAKTGASAVLTLEPS